MAWSEDGTAVFAFRGTSKQQDAWQDLKLLRRGIPFLEEMYPGVKAHVGAPPARLCCPLSTCCGAAVLVWNSGPHARW